MMKWIKKWWLSLVTIITCELTCFTSRKVSLYILLGLFLLIIIYLFIEARKAMIRFDKKINDEYKRRSKSIL